MALEGTKTIFEYVPLPLRIIAGLHNVCQSDLQSEVVVGRVKEKVTLHR